jgi:hypothetical protein
MYFIFLFDTKINFHFPTRHFIRSYVTNHHDLRKNQGYGLFYSQKLVMTIKIRLVRETTKNWQYNNVSTLFDLTTNEKNRIFKRKFSNLNTKASAFIQKAPKSR